MTQRPKHDISFNTVNNSFDAHHSDYSNPRTRWRRFRLFTCIVALDKGVCAVYVVEGYVV
jgi:hypothetical protein